VYFLEVSGAIYRYIRCFIYNFS